MATKEELTTEVAVLKSQLAEANAAIATHGESDTTEYAPGLYVYNEGIGFTAVQGGVGLYGYDGEEATRYPLEDGDVFVVDVEKSPEFQKVEIDADAEYVYSYGDGFTLKPRANPDAVSGADGEQLIKIEMMENDLMAIKIQRDEARNEVATLKDRLMNAGALHGTIDNLKPMY